ncbi:MAG: RIP metalloprotease RseP [Thermoanaerobaculia bacterium]
MNLLSNTAAFIFALGVIIFFHELGHLLAAKAFDVRVLTFSLGFGKRLFGFKRGETDYRVALFPLGGYVQLGGEEPGETSDDPREFSNRPRWQRVVVYLAGPAMNAVLSVLLMAVVFMMGMGVAAIREVPPVVGVVVEGSPAAAAGLEPGDRIEVVDGKPVTRWDDVNFALLTSPGRAVELTFSRDGRQLTASVVPDVVPRYEFGDAGIFPQRLPSIAQVLEESPAAIAGLLTGDEVRSVDGRTVSSSQDFIALIEVRAEQPTTIEVMREGRLETLVVTPRSEDGIGKIGVVIGYYQRYGPIAALGASVQYNIDIVRQTFAALGKILSGRLAAKSALSGPIEIAALSGAAARSGFTVLLHLMGIISISIGILNLLPIPILDGGQITILLFEGLRRRDLSIKVKQRIQNVGFALVVLLMVMVLYFDLVKNIPLPGR